MTDEKADKICRRGCNQCPMGGDMELLFPHCFKKLKEMEEDDKGRKSHDN